MATSFGEVVLPSSRAFWDEYEEELIDELEDVSVIDVVWLKDKPTSMKKFVLVEEKIIIDFFEKFLCHGAEKICTIQNELNKELAGIHKVNEDLYICILAPWFDIKIAGEFVTKINDILLICKSIYLISWRYVSDYKSANIPAVPSFLRCLYTNSGKKLCKSHNKILEQPNIIYGVAGGILSFAQMMNLQSVLYVLYTDCFVLDSTAAKPLIEIFAEISSHLLYNISYAGRSYFDKGNLYM